MNRLVAQLLRVARLDSISIEITENLDLRKTTREVVEYLTPWAVAHAARSASMRRRSRSRIRGNSHAIADAVRNLVENAVHHTREGTEVSVAVTPGGSVSVADHGPGIERRRPQTHFRAILARPRRPSARRGTRPRNRRRDRQSTPRRDPHLGRARRRCSVRDAVSLRRRGHEVIGRTSRIRGRSRMAIRFYRAVA